MKAAVLRAWALVLGVRRGLVEPLELSVVCIRNKLALGVGHVGRLRHEFLLTLVQLGNCSLLVGIHYLTLILDLLVRLQQGTRQPSSVVVAGIIY